MEKEKVAFITGVTGQDGSYLSEFLLKKGYSVHGMVRRSSTFNTGRIDHLIKDPRDPSTKFFLHYGDMTDSACISSILNRVKPDEVYNLAAQSHVKVSFDQPVYTCDVDAMGTGKILNAVRETQDSSGKQIRFYQASSSEMFGKVQDVPQKENTPFYPRSPYGCAKLFSHWLTINYRESYDMHASCGILYNHESPRRGETFVTRKITRAVGRIKMGLQKKLYLGNMEALRDWGFAGDFVQAMWMMLQQDEPSDYIIATGRMISVREFCEMAFSSAGMDYRDFVEVDPRYFRPAEVDQLLGDFSKARAILGWRPKVVIEDLAKMMVEHDLELAYEEKTIQDMK